MTGPRIVTVPGVAPVMQVAVGDADVQIGQATYDAAHYDVYPEATYSGLDAQWSDDSCDVIEAVLFYGRERSVDQFDIGTATLRVVNPDGLWDYPPTSDATPIALRPGRQLRVGVIVAGAAPVWLWHGWIDATAPAYDPALGDVVDVSCVCAKGEAGRVEAGRLAAPVGDGESVSARMTRYADAAGFPTHRRQFDQTGTPLIGTTMNGRVGALMDRSARSAGGDVYGDQSGFLFFRGPDWQVRAPGPPDGTIGNRDLPGEVCPNVWEVLFNRSDFSNRVNYGQTGGPVSTIDDPANPPPRFGPGPETYTLTDLETVDAATRTQLAQRVLRARSFDLAPRIAGVTLDAARPGVAALLAAADPFRPSMYNCGHVTRTGRAVFARSMYLTGIEHTISGAAWTARLSLDDAAPWQTNAATFYDAAHYDADRYARAV